MCTPLEEILKQLAPEKNNGFLENTVLLPQMCLHTRYEFEVVDHKFGKFWGIGTTYLKKPLVQCVKWLTLGMASSYRKRA